jgi:sarcosine oxidase
VAVARVDVAVLGAGAMGSATAWQLARRGRSVLLVERFEAGHRNGSSHGGVRIFRHAYGDPHYVHLAARSLALWRELEADTGEHLLDLTGAYDHGPAGTIEPIAAALAGFGVAHEVLDPYEAQPRVPGIRFDTEVLHHPLGGRCFADRTVAALARRAGELGTDVRFRTRATPRPVAGGGVDVVLDGPHGAETVHAGVVVVTAGAWMPDLVDMLGVAPPPVVVTQEQVAHFEPRDPRAAWPSFIHHLPVSRYGMFTPGEGLKVGGHHEGAVVSPDARGFELGTERLEATIEYVREWIPGVVPVPRFGATCLYTTTPNEDFVLDRVGPVVIGSPCSGHGFKFTPLIGQLLADLAVLPDDADESVLRIVEPRHRLAAFGG